MCITASQMQWTADVQKALNLTKDRGDKRALKSLKKKQVFSHLYYILILYIILYPSNFDQLWCTNILMTGVYMPNLRIPFLKMKTLIITISNL